MDTFLPAAVVLLTLGSIGLALVNLNAEKNVNKNYTEESIRGKLAPSLAHGNNSFRVWNRKILH
jgi:hypothetical protein